MKITDIKTKDQFYKFADVWYQRSHKLRRVFQDENETPKRIVKAYILWSVMGMRISKLFEIAKKLEIVTPSRKFNQNGAVIWGNSKQEVIIDKSGKQINL